MLSGDSRPVSPKAQCFPTPEEYQLLISNTVLEQGFTIPSSQNASSPETRQMLLDQNREFLVLKESQGLVCEKNMGDELRYMGTANVVRDMDFMIRVFDGQDAKINYWGASYGSILGAYLVSMLPHRVGYVTIDGIANAVSWSNEPSHKWHKGWIDSAEATLEMYINDCFRAGPELCALVRPQNESPSEILRRIEDFLDELVIKPLPVPHASRPGFLTSGAVRGLLLMTLQRPGAWPTMSGALNEAMNGNGTVLYNSIVHSREWFKLDLVRLAVTCMDSPPPLSLEEYPTAEELTDVMMDSLSTVSRNFGASVSLGEQDGGCQYWPTKGGGPERFTGPWNATLETPMLIVSNTHDPITPLKSGLLINSLMPNSSPIVIQNGPGHCSLAMPSLCTIKQVREYFDSGVIPQNGTRCDINTSTFPKPGVQQSSLSEEDRELLEVVLRGEKLAIKQRFGW